MQKLLMQKSESHKHQLSSVSMNSDNNNDVHFYNDKNVTTVSNDNDTLLLVQRRKLLRRAANRRSAQLSRARKKAHMEELKMDNRKLQRISDFIESIPDLILCVDITGKITYISDNTVCSIKTSSSTDNANDNTCDDDPTHINQILTAESVTILLETIAQLSKENEVIEENGKKVKGAVREIYYHNINGFPVSGYMRCSKIISHPYEIDNNNEITENVVEGPSLKRNRPSSPVSLKSNLNSLAEVAIAAAAAESAADDSRVQFSSINMKGKESKDENEIVYQKVQEEEFICIIRPSGLNHMFENNDQSSGLSKESMVAHDLGHHHSSRSHGDRPRSPSGSTNSNGSFSAHNDNNSSFRGTGSSSSTSRGDKNSTSSETGSDDNGNT